MSKTNARGAAAWDADEDALLLAMRRRGEGDEAIGAALGRTPGSVASRAHNLRRGGVAIPMLSFWTPAQVANLVAMREAGATIAAIAAAIGRSEWAVRERVRYLQADGTLDGGSGGVNRDHVRRIPVDDPLLAALHQEYARRSA